MNAGWQAQLFEQLAARAVSHTYRELWMAQAEYWRAQAGGNFAGGGDVSKTNQLNLNQRKDNNNRISATGVDESPPARVPPAIAFRARNESAWAGVFTALGLQWKYEALEPELSRGLRYQPDFWLVEKLVWIEIKSAPPSEGEIRVARLLRQATARRVYILAGWPGYSKYSVSLFSEAGDFVTARPDWCSVALCVLFDCNFADLYRAFDEVKRGTI